jgi:hypothetical protein
MRAATMSWAPQNNRSWQKLHPRHPHHPYKVLWSRETYCRREWEHSVTLSQAGITAPGCCWVVSNWIPEGDQPRNTPELLSLTVSCSLCTAALFRGTQYCSKPVGVDPS